MGVEHADNLLVKINQCIARNRSSACGWCEKALTRGSSRHCLNNKKGQHRSCHTAKCNMLNKWLNKKTSILVTHTFTFTTIHLKHDLFTHICTNISHTRTTTYSHMHICNPTPKSGKIKSCHLANIEYFLSFILFRLRLRVLLPGEYHVFHTPML